MCTLGRCSKDMYDFPVKKLGRKTYCVKCHEGGDVLVCSHGDCPIVIHESCMSCTARLNDSGNFCCPYCLYKQSLAECDQAKEKVLLAKNALSCFMDKLITEKIGNLRKSKCSKRKVPDSSTSMQNSKVPTCAEVESNPFLGRDTSAKEVEILTKKPRENLDTMGAYQCVSNGKKEQTHEERQKFFGCITRMGTSTDVHEESEKGNYGSIQDENVTSKMEVDSENFQEPEIRENHCSGEDEGLHIAIHSTLDDNVKVTHEEIGNVIEKHQENLKAIDEEGIEKIQQQLNPQETPICLMRNDNIIKKHEQYSVRIGMAVHLEDVYQSADVESHCVDQEKISVKSASHTVEKVIVPMAKVESGYLTTKYQEIANTVEILHKGGGEKKEIPGESQETSVCLKEKQNITKLHKEYVKVNDGKCEDECYTSQMVVNSESVGHVAQNIKDHDDRQPRVKSSEDVLSLTRKDSVTTTHEESEYLVKVHQETAEKDNKYDKRAVVKEHSQPETEQNTFFTTNGDVMRMHEVSNEGSAQSLAPGDCRGKTNAKQKVELPINDVQCVLDTVSVVHEESEGGDSIASVGDSFCMGHGVSSKRKRKMPKILKNYYQPDGLSESSGIEFSDSEEYGEKPPGKSVQNKDPIKQVQRSVLHSPRRAKLPWKLEEVDVLKEGVQKFSLTAKKNLPWRKVLEFGRHIFDGTRTPVDLKDKWRNLTGNGL